MLSRRRVVLAVGLHQSTATATAGYLAVRRRWQRTTLPLGEGQGTVGQTGRLMATRVPADASNHESSTDPVVTARAGEARA